MAARLPPALLPQGAQIHYDSLDEYEADGGYHQGLASPPGSYSSHNGGGLGQGLGQGQGLGWGLGQGLGQGQGWGQGQGQEQEGVVYVPSGGAATGWRRLKA